MGSITEQCIFCPLSKKESSISIFYCFHSVLNQNLKCINVSVNLVCPVWVLYEGMLVRIFYNCVASFADVRCVTIQKNVCEGG